MRVLILDLVHGGGILARRFLSRGDEVVAVDVYKVSKADMITDLLDAGVRVDSQPPKERFDILVMPRHCPDDLIGPAEYSERMSFSKAVGMLIGSGPFRIEVTGVKGKTSTCYFLAHVLDRFGKKVFLHTSRGQGPYADGRHAVTALRSIAPPSILELPDSGYDVVISEVSLGGSGHADISVVVNIGDDYPIAAATHMASEAKAEIFTDGINIIRESEEIFWTDMCPRRRFITFGENCSVESYPKIGEELEISFTYSGEQLKATLRGDYLALQYLPAIDTVIPICERMGVPADIFIEALSTFGGVPGRGEIRFDHGHWMVTERNPGISPVSVGMTLSVLGKMGSLKNCFVIVEPVSRKVCDKMHVGDIAQIIGRYHLDYSVSDGSSSVSEPSGYDTVVRFIKEGWQ